MGKNEAFMKIFKEILLFLSEILLFIPRCIFTGLGWVFYFVMMTGKEREEDAIVFFLEKISQAKKLFQKETKGLFWHWLLLVTEATLVIFLFYKIGLGALVICMFGRIAISAARRKRRHLKYIEQKVEECKKRDEEDPDPLMCQMREDEILRLRKFYQRGIIQGGILLVAGFIVCFVRFIRQDISTLALICAIVFCVLQMVKAVVSFLSEESCERMEYPANDRKKILIGRLMIDALFIILILAFILQWETVGYISILGVVLMLFGKLMI